MASLLVSKATAHITIAYEQLAPFWLVHKKICIAMPLVQVLAKLRSLPYLHTNAGLPRCDVKLDESKDKEGQASVNTAFCFSNQIYFWFCVPNEQK